MYDRSLLFEKLLQIDEALDRIERRFSSITTVDYFLDSEKGLDMLDSIAMMLIAIGENFKKIDKDTKGTLLMDYQNINWSGVKGIRDVLSHQYFNIDAEEIFKICSQDLPDLHRAVKDMIRNMDNS
ncbi:DUF86 domain-containing protein [Prosthecochloris sp. SCSIO W1103]|uniref:HepT-like ribonuclease domain-containing protein n=1 Tax=Prosthecochloris sp. SCSIO W1103 TaxID=2992244 RepID=UPI00223E2B94|nr:HepT-like ribonuclease domain-containing protein [Prosthecochloris sp. SCSIO W1103]UZJ38162.1 DUF86 domain-containing protein [Prosthecochloris sp. SCSIO W1103]